MLKEHMFTLNMIFKNIDGDKLCNVFSRKYFVVRASAYNKLNAFLNRRQMILQCSQPNICRKKE